MDCVVRPLGPDDLALMKEAGPDVFDGPVLTEQAMHFLADPRHHLVGAIVDGRLAGFASAVICLHPDKPPELFIMEVGVAEPMQRRGIGRAVLDALLAHGRTSGCAVAWVATGVDNATAQALYRAVGGQPDEEDAVVFTFPLAVPADAVGLDGSRRPVA